MRAMTGSPTRRCRSGWRSSGWCGGRANGCMARSPRRWLPFIGGGGVGWLARGVAAAPSAMQNLTVDALDAHRLYVVEVRHPVEVPGSEREHLQTWLTKRCGWDVRAPELDATGLKLVGGRLLPGPAGPASFLMYESASGERYTLYASRAKTGTAQMRYTAAENSGAMYWSEDDVGYVLSGPTDKERLESGGAAGLRPDREKGG